MSNDTWRALWCSVGISLIEAADYYNLKDIPPHVRRRLDEILLSTDSKNARVRASEAIDAMFMHCLVHGKASTKEYFLARSNEHEGRAAGYLKRGFTKAAEEHKALAEQWKQKADAAPQQAESPLRKAERELVV